VSNRETKKEKKTLKPPSRLLGAGDESTRVFQWAQLRTQEREDKKKNSRRTAGTGSSLLFKLNRGIAWEVPTQSTLLGEDAGMKRNWGLGGSGAEEQRNFWNHLEMG